MAQRNPFATNGLPETLTAGAERSLLQWSVAKVRMLIVVLLAAVVDSVREIATSVAATLAVKPVARAGAAANVNAPGANAAAVITYTAVASLKHVITGVSWSYVGDDTIAGGNLKIEDVSGTVIFSQDIYGPGQDTIVFPNPIKSAAVNTALIITLAAGGEGVSGKVSVLNHWTEA